jgi:hypothetical protein
MSTSISSELVTTTTCTRRPGRAASSSASGRASSSSTSRTTGSITGDSRALFCAGSRAGVGTNSVSDASTPRWAPKTTRAFVTRRPRAPHCRDARSGRRGSIGGDRCFSTKPGVSGGLLDPRRTAPEDDDQQSWRGAQGDRDARLRELARDSARYRVCLQAIVRPPRIRLLAALPLIVHATAGARPLRVDFAAEFTRSRSAATGLRAPRRAGPTTSSRACFRVGSLPR